MKADIYIQRAAGPETGVTTWLAHMIGKKFVYMAAHEIDVSGEYINNPKWWSPHRFRAKFFSYGLRHADLVITQNEHQKNIFKKTFGKESTVIPSLVESPVLSALPMRERSYALWVGRCDTWKRPEIFLSLAQKLPEFSFVMICPPAQAAPEFSEEIERGARNIPNVKFLKQVARNDIEIYYQQAKLLVLTSEYEGFPNVILEAFKYGTPVVSLTVDPDSIIERFKLGVVASGDIDRLAKEIRSLVHDGVRLERCSKNAISYIATHHNSRIIAEQYRDAFAKLLEKP